MVRASQKARFANEALVDDVVRLDGLFKKGKFKFRALWSVLGNVF